MHTCPPEVSPNCPGHAGWQKFGTCLHEALHHADHDAQTGHCDGFGRWVGLIIQEESETLDSNRDLPVTIPAGTFVLLHEDDAGFTLMEEFPTAQAAQAEFDAWEARYDAWQDAEDTREAQIIASQGRSIVGVW